MLQELDIAGDSGNDFTLPGSPGLMDSAAVENSILEDRLAAIECERDLEWDRLHTPIAVVATRKSDVQALVEDALALHPDNDDAIVQVLCGLRGMKTAIAAAEKTIKARLLEIIQTTGRDITVGDVRYYAGFKTEVECTSIADALESLLAANGGDVRGLADVLSSDPIKHGSAKKLLPAAEYARLFKSERKDKLGEGKPARELLSVDERFISGQIAQESNAA